MWETLQRIWDIKSIRMSILYVLGMMVIFRITAHIPVPGVDIENLRRFIEGNQIFGLLNIFSGGSINNFSLVMLGIAPYITASIIFQLLAMVIPYFEELSKEGESGQQKINAYTRIATVPLALLQAFSFLQLLKNNQYQIFTTTSTWSFIGVMLTVTAGTVFLMWIGELMTEQKVGNGISLIIFAGIMSGLPSTIQNALVNYTSADLYVYISFVMIAILTIVGVIFISEGQRNIPIQYARQGSRGRGVAAVQSQLPLRVNMAGVIPIIFAVSIILFPTVVAQFFVNGTGRSAVFAQQIVSLFQNQLFYGITYFLLVFGFTYFYTAVIFQPQKIAENLQRQGGFIPGIRPGKETEVYLSKTMTRLVFLGALFLSIIAVLPLLMQFLTNSQTLVVGGTSLLIVVSVAIESAKQIQAQLTMHEYTHI